MKIPLKRIIIGVLVIGAIAAVVALNARKKPVDVLVRAVDVGTVESTVTNTRAGTVKPCRRARLAPSSGGQVAKLLVKEGDRVKQNQILMELWNEDLAAQIRLAENEFLAAQDSVAEACVMADSAQRDADRAVALREEKLAAEQSVDQAVSGAKARRAGCDAARTRVSVSQSRVTAARATLERTVVRAPFAGRVAEVNGEQGEFVTPSPPGIPTPPAVDLIDDSCLYIQAPIDEVDAPRILPGMEARITLDAFPKEHFLGAVRRIAPYVQEVEKQSRTVDIEAVFMDEQQYAKLLPGYSADVEVIIEARHDLVRVPTEAVLENGRVLVFRPSDGVLEERKIEVGLANWKYTEVKHGLAKGDLVVLSVDREGVKAGAVAQREAEGKEPAAGTKK
jgi:HlyD family secretion protein